VISLQVEEIGERRSARGRAYNQTTDW